MNYDRGNIDTVANILIADSNPIFRGKVKEMLTDNLESVITAESYSSDDVLTQLAQHEFDILILDLGLSDGNGLNVLKKIRTIMPDMRVLIMSMFSDDQYQESVYRDGARGYVSKANLTNELIPALQKILRGEKYFSCLDNGNPQQKKSTGSAWK
jgi:DNA-binding NarL/FixJ family response regulator